MHRTKVLKQFLEANAEVCSIVRCVQSDARVSSEIFNLPSDFVQKHIGPRDDQIQDMLQFIGFKVIFR